MSLALIAVGCTGVGGGDAPEGVDLHSAGGKVLFKGQPIEGATVTLQPKGPGPDGASYGAFGRTNAEGVFELRAFSEAEGAVPGEYFVAITKTVVEGDLSNEERDKLMQAGKPAPEATTRSVLPEKYADPKTSGLEASVKADGENRFEFTLTE